jgi:chromate transporter
MTEEQLQDADRGTHAPASTIVSLKALVQVFATIGITSFGGGLSGWMYREVVELRRWMSAQEFLTGLSLARTLPGINVVNLAIWIGYRLRRGIGALGATCAVLVGPMVLIIVLAVLYSRWGQSELMHHVLLGVVAAALGLNLSMGVKSLRPATPTPFYAVVVVLVFLAVGVLHWPMVPVAIAAALVSIGWSFLVDGPRGE